MSSEPIRIVLIDDHAVVRKGLRAFLDTYPEIEVVGEAGGGSEESPWSPGCCPMSP